MNIKLYMIRHGKTKLNEENRYIGRATDIGLSDKGSREIRDAAAAGIYPKEPFMVFCSPMQRCLETAEIIYPGRNKTVIDELCEIDFGLFEGKNYEELNGTPYYQEWIDSGGKKVFPEGESIDDYCARVASGLEKIRKYILRELEGADNKKSCGEDSPEAVLICHGGTIMAAGHVLEGREYYDKMLKNGECRLVRL